MIKRVNGNDESLKSLQKDMTKFQTTGSGSKSGPDISKLAKDGRKFFAKMDLFGLDRWFTFEDQRNADDIQMNCHNGSSMDVEWYYLDNVKEYPSEKKSDTK
jgi:hypothetical protein